MYYLVQLSYDVFTVGTVTVEEKYFKQSWFLLFLTFCQKYMQVVYYDVGNCFVNSIVL